MGWLLSHWDGLVGLAGAAYGSVQHFRARRARQKYNAALSALDSAGDRADRLADRMARIPKL